MGIGIYTLDNMLTSQRVKPPYEAKIYLKHYARSSLYII